MPRSLHTADIATIVLLIGRVWGSGLARGPFGAPEECQHDEKGSELSAPAHLLSSQLPKMATPLSTVRARIIVPHRYLGTLVSLPL